MTRTLTVRPPLRSVSFAPHGSDLWATPRRPGVRRPPQPSLLPYSPGPYQDALARRYAFTWPMRIFRPFTRTRAGALSGLRIRSRNVKRPDEEVRSRSIVRQWPWRLTCREVVVAGA